MITLIILIIRSIRIALKGITKKIMHENPHEEKHEFPKFLKRRDDPNEDHYI